MAASQISDKNLVKHFEMFYEHLVKMTLKKFELKQYERTLELITATANLAFQSHSGRFSDARLENPALKIGEMLEKLAGEKNYSPPDLSENSAKRNGKKRVLHAATRLYEVGGHTKLIENWIKKDTDWEHWLAVTQQGAENIPVRLVEIFEKQGGRVVFLPETDSLIKKSFALRKISEACDFIILHHHPWDVTPLAAFAVDNLPPVAVINHADHAFWLGVSTADLVVDLRSYGARLSLGRRGARRSLLLPIPLDVEAASPPRKTARRQLGISEETVVMLSIGAEYKYSPTEKHDFFRTVKKILDANPSAEMYVIGPRFNEKKHPYHERLHYLGIVNDPLLYEKAADIYLEGFPMSSFTALLETVKFGVCPVLMYAPNQIFAFDEELAMRDLPARATDEADYVAKVSALIASAEQRKQFAEATQKNIIHYHGAAGWKKFLAAMYAALEQTKHHPQLVKQTENMTEEEDFNLANLKSAFFQMQNQPPYLFVFSIPEIHDKFNFTETLAVFRRALLSGDVASSADLKKWLGTIREKWNAPPKG